MKHLELQQIGVITNMHALRLTLMFQESQLHHNFILCAFRILSCIEVVVDLS